MMARFESSISQGREAIGKAPTFRPMAMPEGATKAYGNGANSNRRSYGLLCRRTRQPAFDYTLCRTAPNRQLAFIRARSAPLFQAGLLLQASWRSCRQRNGSGPIWQNKLITEGIATPVGVRPQWMWPSGIEAVMIGKRVAQRAHHRNGSLYSRCNDAIQARPELLAPEMVLPLPAAKVNSTPWCKAMWRARGLMQLIGPPTAKDVARDLDISALTHHDLGDRHRNTTLAGGPNTCRRWRGGLTECRDGLCAYNAGPLAPDALDGRLWRNPREGDIDIRQTGSR